MILLATNISRCMIIMLIKVSLEVVIVMIACMIRIRMILLVIEGLSVFRDV